jgi:hypothetical protein
MDENRRTLTVLLFALSAAAMAPFASACAGKSNPPPATAANGTAPPLGGASAPGYASSYPLAQGGYQQPPPGYPQQTPPGYPQPQPPGSPAPAPYAAQPGQPQPAASGAQTPAAPLGPTDPATLQGILQGLQGAITGQMVPPGALTGDVTEAGLKAVALKVAPGMQPEGDELKQVLNEGQHAVMIATLQAGKCYALVGFSPPGGVKDLDLNLLAPPFYLTLAGQDLTHNNTPTVGAAPTPMCPIVPIPFQYKVDILARVGSGQIAVQLYSKTK